jgi:hypothetical protein
MKMTEIEKREEKEDKENMMLDKMIEEPITIALHNTSSRILTEIAPVT